ncbi:hypothetical protein [Nocardioides jiangxiensis]|uniref:Uncharacterized protein n=1 Tax=Nocardioides jiangxiensis TaxID=3064524 RepID=A0ABT9AZG0_9ACTN|nr:hypothetical protein [Nocardioides sp. WY-20]MDO7867979.1 hypothetical protein [Nocardioides sp. WY-20]
MRSSRGAAAWVAAVIAAEVLLVRGAWTLGDGIAWIAGTRVSDLDRLGMDAGPFERLGAGVCGYPLGWFDRFWLRHGDVAQAGVGAAVVVAAIVVFVAAAAGWRRVAVAAGVAGVVLLVVVRLAGHHAHDAFWNGTPPGEGGWSSSCGDDDSSA